MASAQSSSPVPPSRAAEEADTVVKLTPSEWHALLESRSFLDHDDNRFERPRRLCGAAVEIVPDDSFR
jgi:hypothetical protein